MITKMKGNFFTQPLFGISCSVTFMHWKGLLFKLLSLKRASYISKRGEDLLYENLVPGKLACYDYHSLIHSVFTVSPTCKTLY